MALAAVQADLSMEWDDPRLFRVADVERILVDHRICTREGVCSDYTVTAAAHHALVEDVGLPSMILLVIHWDVLCCTNPAVRPSTTVAIAAAGSLTIRT